MLLDARHLSDDESHGTISRIVRAFLEKPESASDRQRLITFVAQMGSTRFNFDGLSLDGMHFQDGRWESSSFGNAHLVQADFTGAHLSKAHFEKAVIEHALFVKADLSEAVLDDTVGAFADFREANLNHAHLNSATLNNTSFSGSNLTEAQALFAHFEGADFRIANCTSTEFAEARFNGADLRGVVFDYANLKMADLNGALLRNSDIDPRFGHIAPVLRCAGEPEPAPANMVDEHCPAGEKCCDDNICMYSMTARLKKTQLRGAIWRDGSTCLDGIHDGCKSETPPEEH